MTATAASRAGDRELREGGPPERIRIAFVKFGGLGSGGTERWLQKMAANLPRMRFAVDYFYSDAAPFLGSTFAHPDTNPARLAYMREHGVNLIKFRVAAVDARSPTMNWIDTDFWDLFEPARYDFVQTGKAGPPEYPFFLLPNRVIEYRVLATAVDDSANIAFSIHDSHWQRRHWLRMGGDLSKSAVIPPAIDVPPTTEDMRTELGIPEGSMVAGFHQRNDPAIFSPIPLEAFRRISAEGRHFVVNGSARYREQAAALGLRNVHFIGLEGDTVGISRFLNTLDVFAHGRRDGETFGTVIAEAMMHAKPCLSHWSDSGNNAQLETMGPAGLFAVGLEDYTRKLDRLYSDATLRERLGRKGRSLASEYYSVERCVRMLGDTYEHLFRGRTDLPVTNEPSYGYVAGFFYAGRTEDPSHPAHWVATGSEPHPFEAHMLRLLLRRTRVFLDLDPSADLLGFMAAKWGDPGIRVVLIPHDERSRDELERTVWLNNWEETITVSSAASPGLGTRPDERSTGSPLSLLNTDGVDLIALDGSRPPLPREVETLMRRHRPAVLVRSGTHAAGQDRVAATLELIAADDYIVLRCSPSGRLKRVSDWRSPLPTASYVCLHRTSHRTLIQRAHVWAFQYRLQRLRTYLTKVLLLGVRVVRGLRHPREAVRVLFSWQRRALVAEAVRRSAEERLG